MPHKRRHVVQVVVDSQTACRATAENQLARTAKAVGRVAELLQGGGEVGTPTKPERSCFGRDWVRPVDPHTDTNTSASERSPRPAPRLWQGHTLSPVGGEARAIAVVHKHHRPRVKIPVGGAVERHDTTKIVGSAPGCVGLGGSQPAATPPSAVLHAEAPEVAAITFFDE